MAIIGFILSFLVLCYLSFCCAVLPYAMQFGGGLKGWAAFLWVVSCVAVLFLWLILFTNSPFTITVSPA